MATYAYNHRVRMKRGKKRYYPTSNLRKKFKRGMKKQGYGRKAIRKSVSAGWW